MLLIGQAKHKRLKTLCPFRPRPIFAEFCSIDAAPIVGISSHTLEHLLI